MTAPLDFGKSHCRNAHPLYVRPLWVQPRVMTTDFVVRRALVLLERNPERRWTVEDIAAALGVSRAVLGRRFAAALAAPPLRVLTGIRMRRAEALLRETDDGLAKIADAVGYDSEFAFSRAFKRAFQLAPILYRRRAREHVLALAV